MAGGIPPLNPIPRAIADVQSECLLPMESGGLPTVKLDVRRFDEVWRDDPQT
jgi:hypothetical protein